MICLQYIGPDDAGRTDCLPTPDFDYFGPHWPPDPDTDDYIAWKSDPTGPALVHIAPAPSALPHVPPAPPVPPIRFEPSSLPPLPRWPAADAPGRLNEAKACQAIAWLVAGYGKTTIGIALSASRSAITSLAHGRSWGHLPWPPGFGHCGRGCREVTRDPFKACAPCTGQEDTNPVA